MYIFSTYLVIIGIFIIFKNTIINPILLNMSLLDPFNNDEKNLHTDYFFLISYLPKLWSLIRQLLEICLILFFIIAVLKIIFNNY